MGEVYLRRGHRGSIARWRSSVLPADEVADRSTSGSSDSSARRKAVAALNHPNIVTIYSVEEADGVHLLTMERVEGKNLDQILPPSGYEVDQVFPFAIQIADAIAAAHDKGITHRDLKPANVMVTDEGRVKVLDFGLAKLAGPEAEEDAATELMTRAGMILGTAPYMAPEQVQGQPIDHRSDVFSLGILLYEMATGYRPFQGDDTASVMASILKDEPDFESGIEADLPAATVALIESCLQKDPASRPNHAGEVRDALRAQQQAAADASRPIRRPLVRIGAAALVTLLIVLGWFLVRRNRSLAFQANALPQLAEIAREERFVEAFELARKVEDTAGIGTISEEIWNKVSQTVSVTSEPPGAQVTVTSPSREQRTTHGVGTTNWFAKASIGSTAISASHGGRSAERQLSSSPW